MWQVAMRMRILPTCEGNFSREAPMAANETEEDRLARQQVRSLMQFDVSFC